MNIYLEKRDPAHNQHRFYGILLAPTLFGAWAVIREWGRIGQPGTVRESWFETEALARAVGLKLKGRKERRGYRHARAADAIPGRLGGL